MGAGHHAEAKRFGGDALALVYGPVAIKDKDHKPDVLGVVPLPSFEVS